ncbi:YchJ family protein [Neisseria weaveri]|uniref:UPF0225 protein NCTC12742_01433 n=1 Tax=Neisseria weaveri TaxID=28091 RepID=A0A448VNZ1_9NEIS|nr:YchJ family protein [Neisseria weaveri]SAY52110.1 SEC-C domain-containing protein [Neisseria weaveri]VEJ51535.1 SEC-C domain-containing protein [Neisseria weaveri]
MSMTENQPCPCGSNLPYKQCCQLLHSGRHHANNAEALMRSRYSAYVLHEIGYLIATTVPDQQTLLDTDAISHWSRHNDWLALRVLTHIPNIGKQHAQVEFEAHFADEHGKHIHHECSAFVRIDGKWYFIDPTVPLPTMKQPCICGSGKKFKQCCGQFFK